MTKKQMEEWKKREEVAMEFIHGKRFDQFREELDRETMSRESHRTSWWWEEEEGQRAGTESGEEGSKFDLMRGIPL